jgi:hypothetical protein
VARPDVRPLTAVSRLLRDGEKWGRQFRCASCSAILELTGAIGTETMLERWIPAATGVAGYDLSAVFEVEVSSRGEVFVGNELSGRRATSSFSRLAALSLALDGPLRRRRVKSRAETASVKAGAPAVPKKTSALP